MYNVINIDVHVHKIDAIDADAHVHVLDADVHVHVIDVHLQYI